MASRFRWKPSHRCYPYSFYSVKQDIEKAMVL
jgi:hypothetical protein